jgi:dihydropteroate synthase
MAATTIFPAGRVTIVGVLNLTPDSFSDGGRLLAASGGAARGGAGAAARARGPARRMCRPRSRSSAPAR